MLNICSQTVMKVQLDVYFMIYLIWFCFLCRYSK